MVVFRAPASAIMNSTGPRDLPVRAYSGCEVLIARSRVVSQATPADRKCCAPARRSIATPRVRTSSHFAASAAGRSVYACSSVFRSWNVGLLYSRSLYLVMLSDKSVQNYSTVPGSTDSVALDQQVISTRSSVTMDAIKSTFMPRATPRRPPAHRVSTVRRPRSLATPCAKPCIALQALDIVTVRQDQDPTSETCPAVLVETLILRPLTTSTACNRCLDRRARHALDLGIALPLTRAIRHGATAVGTRQHNDRPRARQWHLPGPGHRVPLGAACLPENPLMHQLVLPMWLVPQRPLSWPASRPGGWRTPPVRSPRCGPGVGRPQPSSHYRPLRAHHRRPNDSAQRARRRQCAQNVFINSGRNTTPPQEYAPLEDRIMATMLMCLY